MDAYSAKKSATGGGSRLIRKGLDGMPFEQIGRILVFAGLLLAAFGLFIMLGGKFIALGRLPGDIVIRRGNFTFYFPVVTSILISVVLSLIGWVLTRR